MSTGMAQNIHMHVLSFMPTRVFKLKSAASSAGTALQPVNLWTLNQTDCSFLTWYPLNLTRTKFLVLLSFLGAAVLLSCFPQSVSAGLWEVFWEEVLRHVQEGAVWNTGDLRRGSPLQEPLCHQVNVFSCKIHSWLSLGFKLIQIQTVSHRT